MHPRVVGPCVAGWRSLGRRVRGPGLDSSCRPRALTRRPAVRPANPPTTRMHEDGRKPPINACNVSTVRGSRPWSDSALSESASRAGQRNVLRRTRRRRETAGPLFQHSRGSAATMEQRQPAASGDSEFKKASEQGRGRLVPVKRRATDKTPRRGRPRPIERTLRIGRDWIENRLVFP